jgi:hypothetical protein
MPVSKHRRRNETRPRKPEPAPAVPRPEVRTIDDLRQAIADPALDFPAKAVVAGLWWFQQMLLRVGDRPETFKASRQDKRTAGLLLCVAMDGENGKNDDLSPLIADLLRPYCSAPTFAEGWEQAKRLPPGTVRTKAARALARSGKPAA